MIDEIEAKKRICPRYKQGMLSNPTFAYIGPGVVEPLVATIDSYSKCDGSACFEWEICLAYKTTAVKKLHKEGVCTIGYPGCIDDCDGHICSKLLETKDETAQD